MRHFATEAEEQRAVFTPGGGVHHPGRGDRDRAFEEPVGRPSATRPAGRARCCSRQRMKRPRHLHLRAGERQRHQRLAVMNMWLHGSPSAEIVRGNTW